MKKIIDKAPFLLALFLLFAFDFGMTMTRIYFTDKTHFSFLVWNLFLAFLPLVFIQVALGLKAANKSTFGVFIFGLLTLLFLPNSPYIITDLFHLVYWKKNAPLWFDTMLIFSYAITGIVLFYATLLGMEKLLRFYLRTNMVHLSMIAIIFLNAFGIYLGRYMRFNSWDIISNPMGLVEEIAKRFINPFGHPATWGLTLSYGMLFMVGFCCLKLLLRSAKQVEGRSI